MWELSYLLSKSYVFPRSCSKNDSNCLQNNRSRRLNSDGRKCGLGITPLQRWDVVEMVIFYGFWGNFCRFYVRIDLKHNNIWCSNRKIGTSLVKYYVKYLFYAIISITNCLFGFDKIDIIFLLCRKKKECLKQLRVF